MADRDGPTLSIELTPSKSDWRNGSTGYRLGHGALVLLTIALVVYIARILLRGNTGPEPWFDSMLYHAVLLGSAAAVLGRGLALRSERRAWILLGAAMGFWAAGDLYYTFVLANDDPIPFPSVADGMWLAFYPLAYAAIGSLMWARTTLLDRSFWLDGLIGALTVAAVGSAIVFKAVLDSTGGSAAVVATNLAYPLGDLLLISMIVGLVALTGWRPGGAWILLAGGCATFAVSDSVYLYQTAVGSYAEGTILDAGWPAASLILSYAAWQPLDRVPRARLAGWRRLAFPTAFASIAFALLVYDRFQPVATFAWALAAASLVAVVVRLGVTMRENDQLLAASQKEAVTDSLTGLSNRRKLMVDLRERLTAARDDDRLVLALLDLDGFKSYNDAFGHPAGDALLTRLAHSLGRAATEHGEAYRMGGDEFCVLASLETVALENLVDRATGALQEHGEGFTITAACGAVLLPVETRDVSEALRIADARMYTHKDSRRPSAGRQSRDVLLSVLQERDPRLGGHLAGVGQLAEAVGRRLGLGVKELEQLRQAAELHDVGKLAIPETILNKTTQLSEEEWEFVRRHTLVGERILAAAPSLVPAARLVRASHERLDGAGYPDGLVGDGIPLGSRIIFACDAFDAMTSERPYGVRRTPDEAIGELRSCAGTQFDPEVVEALVSVYADVTTELVA